MDFIVDGNYPDSKFSYSGKPEKRESLHITDLTRSSGVDYSSFLVVCM